MGEVDWSGLRQALSASKPDHDSSGNREPLEGLGALGGGASPSDSWSQHAQWKRGVRDQRQGTGLKDTDTKVRASSGASQRDWKSRYKRESGGKTQIHLHVLSPPYPHLHCHFKMSFLACIKKNKNSNKQLKLATVFQKVGFRMLVLRVLAERQVLRKSGSPRGPVAQGSLSGPPRKTARGWLCS